MRLGICIALALLCFCSKKVTNVAINETPQEVVLQKEVEIRPKIMPSRNRSQLDQIAAFDRTIYFGFDRFDIRESELAILQESARIMRENPHIKIRITGHACEIGSSDYNFALGLKRSREASEWLIANGVDANRIEIASRGELEPVSRELSKNRRCEIMTIFGGK